MLFLTAILILLLSNVSVAQTFDDRQNADCQIDNTSYIYQNVKSESIPSAIDSAHYFYVFNNGSTVKTVGYNRYGLHAKDIKITVDPPRYLHFKLANDKISETYPDWLIFALLLSVGLVIIAEAYQRGIIKRIFLAAIYQNTFNSFVNERNINADKALTSLLVSYFINVGVFAMIFMSRFNIKTNFSQVESYFAATGITLIVFFVKWAVSAILSKLFRCDEICELHYKNVRYIIAVVGVLLIPLNLFSLYIDISFLHKIVFFLTCITCSIYLIFKWLRLFKIIISKHFSIFYLFLYLCGVEIMPALVGIRFATA